MYFSLIDLSFSGLLTNYQILKDATAPYMDTSKNRCRLQKFILFTVLPIRSIPKKFETTHFPP